MATYRKDRIKRTTKIDYIILITFILMFFFFMYAIITINPKIKVYQNGDIDFFYIENEK